MTNPFKKQIGFLFLSVMLAASFSSSAQTVLFQDNFETDTSTNWNIFAGGNYSAQFNFNYSTVQYLFNNSPQFIPQAPNSGSGGTKGVRLAVNKGASGVISGVSLFPKNQSFSNSYALKFDLWLNYANDSGTTEMSSFGINHLGNKVCYASGSTATNTVSPYTGDGLWFAATGENGWSYSTLTGSGDFRVYEGNPANGFNNRLRYFEAGFLDRNNDGFTEYDSDDPLIQDIFPAPVYETPGAIGKHWVEGEIRQLMVGTNLLVTWLLDGYVIAERTNTSIWTSGNIMIGHIDPFASLAAPPQDGYAIFDNVRVVTLGTNPIPTVTIAAADPNGAESGPDPAMFTVTRTGDTSLPLTVGLKITGTASNGADYVTIPGTITIPAGAADTNITVQVINDSIGEPTESVVITLAGSTNSSYDLRANFRAQVDIADDGDLPVASITTQRAVAYEMLRLGKLTVELSNPTFDNSTITVPLTITGTASNGVHYAAIPASVSFPPGETIAPLIITPIDNNVIDGTRTVTVTANPGSGYTLGSVTNGTVSIKDDDLPPGMGILYANDFDTDTTPDWIVNANRSGEDTADFFYDYSADGIIPAPRSTNSTTRGIKLKANFTSPASSTSPPSGISVSPVGQNFAGNYRLRFDMWINYNGPLLNGGFGSTEYMSAGVGTTGNHPNWDSGSNIVDGIWFSADGDGFGDAYKAFRGPTALSGVYTAGSQSRSNPHYSDFGGDPAPQAQIDANPEQTGTAAPGNPGFAWHDIVITKQGNAVNWSIDGVSIATVVATNTLSGNIFVGYYDPVTGTSPNSFVSFGLIDNLRVEQLAVSQPPQPPNITGIQVSGGTTVAINFTGGTNDTASAFTLQSATLVQGPYSNESVVATGAGPFQFTIAANGPARFYRIRR